MSKTREQKKSVRRFKRLLALDPNDMFPSLYLLPEMDDGPLTARESRRLGKWKQNNKRFLKK